MLNILFISSDLFPPQRIDVKVLFGEKINLYGHHIDWLLQSEEACDHSYETSWANGTVWVGARKGGDSLLSSFRRHISGLLNDLKLVGFVRQRRYDLIIVKDKFLSAVLAVIACKIWGGTVVYWLSWPFPEEYLAKARLPGVNYPLLYRARGHTFWFLLYKIIMPGCDHIFVQSEQMKRDVENEGISSAKLTPVPMGVDASDIQDHEYTNARELIPQSEKCFLYLGILSRMRQLDFLVRVLALVRKQIRGTKLYLVGAGESHEDEEIIRAEIKRLDLDDAVVMTGHLPREVALQYAKEVDVCVSPFAPVPILNSTSPTKLIEYLALGKAVVANDHPEQHQVLTESGAGICVEWDEQQFADAIIRLLSDSVLNKKMSERGAPYVRTHRTYDAIAKFVESELLKVVQKRVKGSTRDAS